MPAHRIVGVDPRADRADDAAPSAASPLARYLAGAWAILVAYGSLFPLAGWRATVADPFAFLAAPLPRYITGFDVGVNALAYAPLGFLLALAVHPRLRGALAVAAGCIASALLSLGLETLQSYLPSRIPSNLDFGLNVVGGTLGALAGVALAPRIVAEGGMRGMRERWFLPGSRVDFGLTLLALWLLTQLDPETLLFGNGDLRNLFTSVPSDLHPPELFVRIEALVSGANVVAVSLLAGALVRSRVRAAVVVLALCLAALLVRSAAFATLFQPQEAFAWATPGAALGLASGLVVAGVLGLLPRPARVALAGSLLMLATVLVNFAPGNPYLAHSLAVWKQGHFLNFVGLTSAMSSAWPFVAMAWLLATGARPRR